jgi:hypothetical protein
VFGVVNTTRGEVRRGPRSRPVADDAASLLGTYLAAASLSSLLSGDSDDDDTGLQTLGRILRDRGSGGGIDIHIHAVVTAPGGALPAGLAALGGGGGGGAGGANGGGVDAGSIILSTRSPSRATPNRASSAQPLPSALQEDDEGIFSALYSENPAPVDPSRPLYLEESAPPIAAPAAPLPRLASSRPASTSSRTSPLRNSGGTDRASVSRRRSGGSRSSDRRSGNFLSRFLRRSNAGN